MKIDKLIRSKRKTIALIVQLDGSLVVRAPLFARDEQIQAFIKKKTDWIRTRQAEARAARPVVHTFADGDSFLYLGRTYPLRVVNGAKKALEFKDAFLLAESARPRARQLLEAWYKARAREIITQRVMLYAATLGFSYTKIRIGSAKTRWGSCSTRGTLSFAWRLVMAPLQVVDYVIIHELVHTIEHNHSQAFWARVAQVVPDYKARAKWLKENAHLMEIAD